MLKESIANGLIREAVAGEFSFQTMKHPEMPYDIALGKVASDERRLARAMSDFDKTEAEQTLQNDYQNTKNSYPSVMNGTKFNERTVKTCLEGLHSHTSS